MTFHPGRLPRRAPLNRSPDQSWRAAERTLFPPQAVLNTQILCFLCSLLFQSFCVGLQVGRAETPSPTRLVTHEIPIFILRFSRGRFHLRPRYVSGQGPGRET